MLRFKQMYLYYVQFLEIIKTVGQYCKTKERGEKKMLEGKYRGTIGESARMMKKEKIRLR